MKDLLQRLTDGDPWPAHVDLPAELLSGSALLSVIDERRHTMKTLERGTTATGLRNRTGRIVVALAVAAVIAVVIGVSTFLRAPRSGPVADGDTGAVEAPALPWSDPAPLPRAEPVEVAITYLERLNDGDLAGALSLFSAEYRLRPFDGVTTPTTPSEVSAIWARYHIAMSGNIDYRCEPAPTGPEWVMCDVTTSDELTRATGVEPPTYVWEFFVEEGLIDRGEMNPDNGDSLMALAPTNPYSVTVASFGNWLRDNHIDEYLAACRTGGVFPLWSPACAQLQLTNLAEFAGATG